MSSRAKISGRCRGRPSNTSAKRRAAPTNGQWQSVQEETVEANSHEYFRSRGGRMYAAPTIVEQLDAQPIAAEKASGSSDAQAWEDTLEEFEAPTTADTANPTKAQRAQQRKATNVSAGCAQGNQFTNIW
jgi:hypothetical protein